MNAAQTLQQIAPTGLGELREVLAGAAPHLNHYFYMEPPRRQTRQGGRQLNLDLFKPDVEREDHEVAKEAAERVAVSEAKNLDADKAAQLTDWTVVAPEEDEIMEDNEPLEFDLACEDAPCEERKEIVQTDELLRQLPNSSHLSAEQFAQFADEIMKRSMFVYETLI